MQKVALLTLCVLGFASANASADVQLSIQNGRITILAKDATLRQILTEWARVGQTKIVNVERIPGTPLTIELRDMPEQQALMTLLRSISGYVAAPRTSMVAADTSVFDRIIVMPTVAAASAPSSNAPPPITSSPPVFTQAPPPEEDSEQRPPGGVPNPAGNRGPVFVFPQPQVTTGQPPVPNPAGGTPPPFIVPPPTTTPTPPPAVSYPGAPTTPSPVGVAVPGMLVPAPQPQPGQPGQPAPQQQQ